MRTMLAGALALALLAAVHSPPVHALDRPTMCSLTQPDGAPPLELAAPAADLEMKIAVAHPSVAPTADAPLVAEHVASPEVLEVAHSSDARVVEMAIVQPDTRGERRSAFSVPSTAPRSNPARYRTARLIRPEVRRAGVISRG